MAYNILFFFSLHESYRRSTFYLWNGAAALAEIPWKDSPPAAIIFPNRNALKLLTNDSVYFITIKLHFFRAVWRERCKNPIMDGGFAAKCDVPPLNDNG